MVSTNSNEQLTSRLKLLKDAFVAANLLEVQRGGTLHEYNYL
jgi:hypothetical protein